MTTTEEVIRLARKAAVPRSEDPVLSRTVILSVDEMARLVDLVKAEENEALTAAIDALEGITVVKYDPNGTTTEFTPCKLDIKA